MKIYGVENVWQIPGIREKIKKTCTEKYGGNAPTSSPEIVKKREDNYEKIYGVRHPLQRPEVLEKQRNTLYENGTVPTSLQQKYIYNLLLKEYPFAKINFPIGKFYSGDIVIDNYDIEIDFGGHNLSVKRNSITQEDFDRKEIIRSTVIKSFGYKIIRLISRKDYIPSDEKIFEIISYAKKFFINNPDRSWISFDVDNSCINNAYHKNTNDLLFDFGKLRRLNYKTTA